MPYYHCEECHHEFEDYSNKPKCGWCGAKAYILEDKTPLEKMLENRNGDGEGTWKTLLEKIAKNS